MLQNDLWIRHMGPRMIEPFEPALVTNQTISYGVSSFGYDFRLSEEFLFFQPPPGTACIDPKSIRPKDFEKRICNPCVLPANQFVLASSMEFFRIPRNILGLCTGKSTYSRCGILVTLTPLEPEWEGRITFPIYNTTPFPIRLYPGEGVAQVLFLEGQPPEISYADRKGKYQGQRGIQPARV